MVKLDEILVVEDNKAIRYIANKTIMEMNIAKEINFHNTGIRAMIHLMNLKKNNQAFPEIIYINLGMLATDTLTFADIFKRMIKKNKKTTKVLHIRTLTSPKDTKGTNSSIAGAVKVSSRKRIKKLVYSSY